MFGVVLSNAGSGCCNLGRRIGKKVGGKFTRKWLYDGQLRIVAEQQMDSSGNVTQVNRFVYGANSNTPKAMLRYAPGGTAPTAVYRIFSDDLGSSRYVVNAANTGEVLFQAHYSAFGIPTPEAGSLDAIPFGFAGGLYDNDTGLVHFGARDYDPMIGRWVSKDPILFRGGQSNIYVYVGNDPVNRRDPSGLWQLFASSDVDLISGESGETNVGFVFDSNTGKCGNFVSRGTGTGLNFGAGAGVGFALRDVSGVGASFDLNAIGISISFLIDNTGFNGILIAGGPGMGFSTSMTNTAVTWY